MLYQCNTECLASLVRGAADPLADDVAARLVTLRAQFTGTGDAGALDLIRRAFDARIAAEHAADEAFLKSLIDGSADCFADGLYDRLAPLHERYRDDAAMLDLFNGAATAYADAVVAAAEWCLAGLDAQNAIDRAAGRERWD